MERGAWGEVHGERCMGRGAWGEVNGERCMGTCAWGEVYGERCMGRGAWREVNGLYNINQVRTHIHTYMHVSRSQFAHTYQM